MKTAIAVFCCIILFSFPSFSQSESQEELGSSKVPGLLCKTFDYDVFIQKFIQENVTVTKCMNTAGRYRNTLAKFKDKHGDKRTNSSKVKDYLDEKLKPLGKMIKDETTEGVKVSNYYNVDPRKVLKKLDDLKKESGSYFPKIENKKVLCHDTKKLAIRLACYKDTLMRTKRTYVGMKDKYCIPKNSKMMNTCKGAKVSHSQLKEQGNSSQNDVAKFCDRNVCGEFNTDESGKPKKPLPYDLPQLYMFTGQINHKLILAGGSANMKMQQSINRDELANDIATGLKDFTGIIDAMTTCIDPASYASGVGIGMAINDCVTIINKFVNQVAPVFASKEAMEKNKAAKFVNVVLEGPSDEQKHDGKTETEEALYKGRDILRNSADIADFYGNVKDVRQAVKAGDEAIKAHKAIQSFQGGGDAVKQLKTYMETLKKAGTSGAEMRLLDPKKAKDLKSVSDKMYDLKVGLSAVSKIFQIAGGVIIDAQNERRSKEIEKMKGSISTLEKTQKGLMDLRLKDYDSLNEVENALADLEKFKNEMKDTCDSDIKELNTALNELKSIEGCSIPEAQNESPYMQLGYYNLKIDDSNRDKLCKNF